MDDGNGQVTFMFQVGLVRDFITTDASQLTLKTLKDLACNFINQRVIRTLRSPFLKDLLFFEQLLIEFSLSISAIDTRKLNKIDLGK